MRTANLFERRNCLKKKMRECEDSAYQDISNCNEYSKKLRKLDHLRNAAAHAYTDSRGKKEEIRGILNKTIDFVEPILKGKQ